MLLSLIANFPFLECNIGINLMTVKTKITENIAEVTLSRPEVHNAFNDEMIKELTKAFLELSTNKNIRVIILAGEGKSFCAGGDLNWMKKAIDYTYEENIEDSLKLAKMFRTINECPKPVIARIQGTAIGGGVGLVSVCDVSCTVSTAKFSLSEVKIGLIPAVISPFVMKKIFPGEARRYFLTGERFDANEAKRIGLISEVASDEEEMDKKINEWTEAMLSGGPEAISTCKKMIRDVAFLNTDEALELSSKELAERRASKEGQEGIKAFFEKRKPNWINE